MKARWGVLTAVACSFAMLVPAGAQANCRPWPAVCPISSPATIFGASSLEYGGSQNYEFDESGSLTVTIIDTQKSRACRRATSENQGWNLDCGVVWASVESCVKGSRVLRGEASDGDDRWELNGPRSRTWRLPHAGCWDVSVVGEHVRLGGRLVYYRLHIA
jgi:hypothetical protein